MSNKTNLKSSGFTLVELLIVIVIIAILATISITLYSGSQKRAKTSTGLATASQVLNKATLSYTVDGKYPANKAGFGADSPEGSLDDTTQAKVIDGAIIDEAQSEDGTIVGYEVCTGNEGAKVTYWDFVDGIAKSKTAGSGC